MFIKKSYFKIKTSSFDFFFKESTYDNARHSWKNLGQKYPAEIITSMSWKGLFKLAGNFLSLGNGLKQKNTECTHVHSSYQLLPVEKKSPQILKKFESALRLNNLTARSRGKLLQLRLINFWPGTQLELCIRGGGEKAYIKLFPA